MQGRKSLFSSQPVQGKAAGRVAATDPEPQSPGLHGREREDPSIRGEKPSVTVRSHLALTTNRKV